METVDIYGLKVNFIKKPGRPPKKIRLTKLDLMMIEKYGKKLITGYEVRRVENGNQ